MCQNKLCAKNLVNLINDIEIVMLAMLCYVVLHSSTLTSMIFHIVLNILNVTFNIQYHTNQL